MLHCIILILGLLRALQLQAANAFACASFANVSLVAATHWLPC